MRYRQHKGRAPTDARYGSRRWKAIRKRVMVRDLWTCFVDGCPWPASVADHEPSAYPGMPDSEFYGGPDLQGLRASCRNHNLSRAVAVRMERINTGQAETPAPRRYSYGSAGRPRQLQRTPPMPVQPLIDRPDVGRHPYPYHKHIQPNGDELLTGYMGGTRWQGPGCPPGCTLPKPVLSPPRGPWISQDGR